MYIKTVVTNSFNHSVHSCPRIRFAPRLVSSVVHFPVLPAFFLPQIQLKFFPWKVEAALVCFLLLWHIPRQNNWKEEVFILADDLGGFNLWLIAFLVYEYPLRQKSWAERCSGGGCSCHGGQGSSEGQRKGCSKILSKGNPRNYLFPLNPML